MAFQAALEENRRALHLGLPKIFSEVLSVIAAEHLIEYMMLMTRATMMSARKCGGEPHSSLIASAKAVISCTLPAGSA